MYGFVTELHAEALADLMQGFAALLEPFYGGKSLTDKIDTAKVRRTMQL